MAGPNSLEIRKKSSLAKAQIAETIRHGLAINSKDVNAIFQRHGLKGATTLMWGYGDMDRFGINIETVQLRGTTYFLDADLDERQRRMVLEVAQNLTKKTKKGRRIFPLLG